MISRTVGKYVICITDISTINLDKIDQNTLIQGCYKTNYIPSVNTQYLIHDSRKILDPEIKKERRIIYSHLRDSGYSRNCIPDDCKLTIEFGFYMNHSINSRDLDNLLKSQIDLLAEYFQFNDNRIYQLSCYKRLILNSEKELVHFRIKKCNLENKSIDYRLISN